MIAHMSNDMIKDKLIQHASDLFKKIFGFDAEVIAIAPGRVELLGNHTDYNQGLVMALAIDKYIVIAGNRRPDSQVHLYSEVFDAQAVFNLQDIKKDPASPWTDYTKGLIIELINHGFNPAGFNGVIVSNLPVGAGLSSSAALLVASAMLIKGLYPYEIRTFDNDAKQIVKSNSRCTFHQDSEKMALAKICQAAENKFVGVNCGLLDHISSIYGKSNHTILIDCLDLNVNWRPLPDEIGVVVANSGVKRALVAGEYNERRWRCEETARILGIPSLRYATLSMLEEAKNQLDDKNYRYALHIIGENERVWYGSNLLQKGMLKEFGRLLFESHESSRVNFQNSCEELDLLVELARQHPACLGARLSGGGFGGATINLVWRESIDDFILHISKGYLARTSRNLEAWKCNIVDGANFILLS